MSFFRNYELDLVDDTTSCMFTFVNVCFKTYFRLGDGLGSAHRGLEIAKNDMRKYAKKTHDGKSTIYLFSFNGVRALYFI